MLNTSKMGLLGLLAAIVAGGWYLAGEAGVPAGAVAGASLQAADPARAAFERRSSGTVLSMNGVVERILADDRAGSPHQRFIVRTGSGLSVLIAHNLDLAPRLQGLAAGDRISVLGQYEWNEKGGVMHWTHDDPAGRHAAGYIEWQGRRYQ